MSLRRFTRKWLSPYIVGRKTSRNTSSVKQSIRFASFHTARSIVRLVFVVLFRQEILHHPDLWVFHGPAI